MDNPQQVIDQTKRWINDVVVGCNFCPFAATVMQQQSVHYQVESSSSLAVCIDAFTKEVSRLDDEPNIATSFLIFPNSFQCFDDYLGMVSLAEKSLKQNGYNGVYQLASFHPLYLFANSCEEDAANYTNRSVYPMLHLLRESGISNALMHYKNPEGIPDRNIGFARKKGLVYMKMLRDTCVQH
jgi:uncharacterized protein